MNVNKEQDAIRLSSSGSCADCGRPMADKVADFALETQGQECLDKDQIIFAKIQCVHVCVCCFCTQKNAFYHKYLVIGCLIYLPVDLSSVIILNDIHASCHQSSAKIVVI